MFTAIFSNPTLQRKTCLTENKACMVWPINLASDLYCHSVDQQLEAPARWRFQPKFWSWTFTLGFWNQSAEGVCTLKMFQGRQENGQWKVLKDFNASEAKTKIKQTTTKYSLKVLLACQRSSEWQWKFQVSAHQKETLWWDILILARPRHYKPQNVFCFCYTFTCLLQLSFSGI